MLDVKFVLLSAGLAVCLFLAMLLFLEVGRRIALERTRAQGAEARAGVGIVDSAVYGLLALLIGFSFSGAAQRFDQRRVLVAEVENAAGTAWLRIEMLPDEQQPSVRARMKRYVDELIAYYATSTTVRQSLQEPRSLLLAEDELWSRAVAACKAPGGESARLLLLPALNETFDAVGRERMARRIHPSIVVYVMLAIAALAAALFAGYGMAGGTTRNWMFMVGIAASISMATYVIIELEYPRVGLFRVTSMDQVIIDLREKMR
jgi:hypothetical protein